MTTLNITGEETFDLDGLTDDIKPQQEVTLVIHRKDGSEQRVGVLLRIDTPIEVGLLQARRHSAVRPAFAAGGVILVDASVLQVTALY